MRVHRLFGSVDVKEMTWARWTGWNEISKKIEQHRKGLVEHYVVDGRIDEMKSHSVG